MYGRTRENRIRVKKKIVKNDLFDKNFLTRKENIKTVKARKVIIKKSFPAKKKFLKIY